MFFVILYLWLGRAPKTHKNMIIYVNIWITPIHTVGGLLPPSSWLKPWTLADRNYVCAICFLVCLSKGESIIDLRDYWAGLLALVYLPVFCKEQFFFFLLLLCDVPNLGRSNARAQGVCWKFLCLWLFLMGTSEILKFVVVSNVFFILKDVSAFF